MCKLYSYTSLIFMHLLRSYYILIFNNAYLIKNFVRLCDRYVVSIRPSGGILLMAHNIPRSI
jgi:hypothetical protein